MIQEPLAVDALGLMGVDTHYVFELSKFCEVLEVLVLSGFNGAPERIRTSDLCLRRALTYTVNFVLSL